MADLQVLQNDDPNGVRVTLDTQKTIINQNFAALNTAKYEKPTGGIPESDLDTATQTKVNNAYAKPAGGIPKTDLEVTVQTILASVAGKYVKPVGGIPAADLDTATQGVLTSVANKYDKPPGGIPASDLASTLQAEISGAYQFPLGGIPSSDLSTTVQAALVAGASAYQKPTGGIPSADLTSALQTELSSIAGKYTLPAGGVPESDLNTALAAKINSVWANSSCIDGQFYGLIPDTGADLTTQLQNAMTAARIANKPVVVRPGKYIYSNLINNAGGGLICPDGWAWFDNQDPLYTNIRIDFASTDSSWQYDIEVRGIKFTCSTRPDSGLTNDAGETAGFIRVVKARRVKIWGNKFGHNYGGCVLFRDVQDSSIIANEAEDIWKDAFHITSDTDGSFNIVRAYNVVRGAGDDPFPVVGYTAKTGPMPTGIHDIGNRVYGVRAGRAFAYVGCRDVKNIGCYVDGRLPADIPQQSSTTIAKYNAPCALYVGAEAGFGTYGCENIEVIGLTAEYLGPPIDTSGNPIANIGTYQGIQIAASNGGSNPHKNIKIDATVRNSATRALFVLGNGATQDIEANITCEDNTDPGGILSLTGTPGLGNQPAVEFQNTRNIKLRLRVNKVAKGALWLDANCSGFADLDLSVGSLCQTTAAQSVITLVSGSKLETMDIKMNFEVTPAASGLGSINRIVDIGTNAGIVRSLKVTGVDHATASANALGGWPARNISPTTSPCTFLNSTGRDQYLKVYGGTVSAIARSFVKGRATATAVTTGASGTVSVNGDFTDLYTASTVVTLFNARGVSIATATVASSALSGGVTTVTFDATGVSASFAVGMQMAIVGTMRTLSNTINTVTTNRTNGLVELMPETAVQVTYSSAPSFTITDASC